VDLISTYIVKTSDLGFHGNLFGGKLMGWVDASAAAYCMQICDTPRVVTVSIDECEFKKPAREGQLVKIYGLVNKINNSSIELNIEARSHNVYTGGQSPVLETTITFVRVDEGGYPIPISDKVRQKHTHKPF
jgi:acyl-CoA thioesterase YciA